MLEKTLQKEGDGKSKTKETGKRLDMVFLGLLC